jgi:hypothetical protein
MKSAWLVAAALLGCVLAVLLAKAGSFLIVDAPRPSDVILVLAGETDRRPERGLELLAQGYGRRMVLDVPTNTKLYEFTQIQLAQKYVQDLPQSAMVSVCAIDGLSTKDESKDAEKCLTSDFHTRWALAIFRREVSGREYSVSAARDEEQFGSRWWMHRQWPRPWSMNGCD